MIAALLAAALNCGGTATQLDLDFCAAHAARAAAARERLAFADASARFPADRALLRASEARWRAYRGAACGYASAVVRGGSLEPMIADQCAADLADGRTRLLRFFGRSGSTAVSAAGARREEMDVYGKLELLVDPGIRSLLERSEDAWLAYAAIACEHAASDCAAAAARDRTATLKASWLADPFW